MKHFKYLLLILLITTSCDNSSSKGNKKSEINNNKEIVKDEIINIVGDEKNINEFCKETVIQDNEGNKAYSFVEVETQPIYPGCEDLQKKEQFDCFKTNILELMRVNFEYPKYALENKIEGRVFVQFIISKEGEIQKISILRSPDQVLTQEAIRLVSLIPKMSQPALQGKYPVPVSFIIPITFRLADVKTKNIEYKIYPNPATNYINIKIENPEIVLEYQISNLNGQIVKSGSIDSSEKRISIYDLKKGMYVIRLVNMEYSFMKIEKLLVN